MPLECPGVLQTIIRRSLVPAGPELTCTALSPPASSPLHPQWALPASGELTSRGPWRNLFWMFCLCCFPTWNPNSLLTFESRLFLRFKSIHSSLRPSWLAGCQAWAGKCPAQRGCKDSRPCAQERAQGRQVSAGVPMQQACSKRGRHSHPRGRRGARPEFRGPGHTSISVVSELPVAASFSLHCSRISSQVLALFSPPSPNFF